MDSGAGERWRRRVSLVRPASGWATPDLDAEQRSVVDATPSGGHVVVWGAPGTGKTTTAIEAAAARLESSGLGTDELLVLAPTRVSASRLRNALSARLSRTSGQPVVRTAASVAYSIVGSRSRWLREPRPRLVTGAEQDLVLGELLDGHSRGIGRDPGWPSSITQEVLALKGFRHELRDLLMRAAERGLDPEGLAELGKVHGRTEWVSAASIYREYLDVMGLRSLAQDAPARYDAAVIVEEAADTLRSWSHVLPDVEPPRWRTVIVDDYQDATLATALLLGAMADGGADLILIGDPDSAIQGFRGGSPHLMARAEDTPSAEPGSFGARRVVLNTVWRQSEELRRVTRAVTDRIAVVGTFAARLAEAGREPDVRGETQADASADPSIDIRLYRSPTQEGAAIARALRHLALREDTPWSDMAVVARSGSDVERLRQALTNASVPVRVSATETAVRDEPAVRPFLVALHCVLEPAMLDADASVTLLTAPIGGADAVALRRLRRALRVEELETGGGRSSDALLAEAVVAPARTATLAADVRVPAVRVARVLEAGREALVAQSASVESVLWALWQASELAEHWREIALGGGPASLRADRDLDAIVALFNAAALFTERNPLAGPSLFLEHLLAEDLPSDTLAARAPGENMVSLVTAASSAGREWPVVIVAGVQDGTWPDLRLRDSLLGAVELADLLSGRGDGAGGGTTGRTNSGTDGPRQGRDLRAARRAVLDDELRSFVVAISRASRRLVLTAVEDADHQPSAFLELVSEVMGDGGGEVDVASAGDVGRPLDLRGLVAHLRADLLGQAHEAQESGTDDEPSARAQEAARVLALLSSERVAGADPSEWYGVVDPSSIDPLWPAGVPVRVSPSKVETFELCGLKWMLEAAGGTVASSSSQSIGTLVHAIAAEFPDASRAVLDAELDRRWHTLGLGKGWLADRERRNADVIMGRLANYLASHPHPIAVEHDVRVEIGRALLVGQIDRVEAGREPGSARIVDLKTGKHAVSIPEGQVNPQLGAYQAAVEHGALEDLGISRAEGAALVYVGGSAKAATERSQDALRDNDDPQWADDMLDRVATGMAQAEFVAHVGPQCRHCPVRSSCPAVNQGRQVTQ